MNKQIKRFGLLAGALAFFNSPVQADVVDGYQPQAKVMTKEQMELLEQCGFIYREDWSREKLKDGTSAYLIYTPTTKGVVLPDSVPAPVKKAIETVADKVLPKTGDGSVDWVMTSLGLGLVSVAGFIAFRHRKTGKYLTMAILTAGVVGASQVEAADIHEVCQGFMTLFNAEDYENGDYEYVGYVLVDHTIQEPGVRQTLVDRQVDVDIVKELPVEIVREVPVAKIIEVIKRVEVETVKEVPVEIIKEVPVEKIVEVTKEVPVEVIKEVPVEIIKEVPVEKIVEVTKEVPVEVIKEVPVEIIKEVPVEKIVEVTKEVPVEVIKEVPVEVIKEVPVEKIVEVVKEVPVEKIVEVVKEVPVDKIVEVVKEVPVEIIKEVPVEVVKEVSVEKIVEVVKEVPVEKIVEVVKEVPVEVVKEVVKEVPVEVIKEVPVEKIVEVVKEVPVEKIVEVTKEVEVEKIVEVIKEVPVEVIKEVTVEKIVEVIKEVPVEKVVETINEGGVRVHHILRSMTGPNMNKGLYEDYTLYELDKNPGVYYDGEGVYSVIRAYDNNSGELKEVAIPDNHTIYKTSNWITASGSTTKYRVVGFREIVDNPELYTDKRTLNEEISSSIVLPWETEAGTSYSTTRMTDAQILTFAGKSDLVNTYSSLGEAWVDKVEDSGNRTGENIAGKWIDIYYYYDLAFPYLVHEVEIEDE